MRTVSLIAAALLSAVAYAEENPAVGKWGCTNVPVQGPETEWMIFVKQDNSKLVGTLTDGNIELSLAKLKFDAATVSFDFEINGKPYSFTGKLDGKKFEGKYSGEEASGKLRCAKSGG